MKFALSHSLDAKSTFIISTFSSGTKSTFIKSTFNGLEVRRKKSPAIEISENKTIRIIHIHVLIDLMILFLRKKFISLNHSRIQ